MVPSLRIFLLRHQTSKYRLISKLWNIYRSQHYQSTKEKCLRRRFSTKLIIYLNENDDAKENICGATEFVKQKAKQESQRSVLCSTNLISGESV